MASFSFSSPAAPQGRFVFGGNQDNLASGETLLASQSQGALGMDDTRMDLSQFDDSSQGGRSAPQTPRARTPPTISITEAPTAGEQEEVRAEDADIVAEMREADAQMSGSAAQQDSQVPQQETKESQDRYVSIFRMLLKT